MLEELGNDNLFELLWILNDECFTIFGPSSNHWIASIDHVISLCVLFSNAEEE